jgi:hypothetical protein
MGHRFETIAVRTRSTTPPPAKSHDLPKLRRLLLFNYSIDRLRGTSVSPAGVSIDGFSGVSTRPTARITLKSPADLARFRPWLP